MTTLTPPSARRPRPNSPVVDLVMAQSRTHRLLLLIGGGVLFILLGTLVLRLWLVHYVQKPVGGQLEYLAAWCGLPPSINASLWVLAFGFGVLAALPMMKKLAFLATGLTWFCPKPAEWALLGILPACTLITPVVQTLCPIREVDPADPQTAWFYPDADPATGQVLGRIGYVREADGTWRFYNICSFHRPSDGILVQRVTPEIRQQWQQEHQRQQEELRRRTEQLQAEQSAQEAERRQREERLAALRLETERQQAEQARAEQAVEAAAQARREAEAARREAAEAQAARARAEQALTEARQQAPAADRESSSLAGRILSLAEPKVRSVKPAETQVPIQRAIPVEESTTPAQMLQATAPAAPPLRELRSPLSPYRWRWVHTRGDRVEVWADGPFTLQADGLQPHAYPGHTWVRLSFGPQRLQALAAGPRTTYLLVRELR